MNVRELRDALSKAIEDGHGNLPCVVYSAVSEDADSADQCQACTPQEGGSLPRLPYVKGDWPYEAMDGPVFVIGGRW